VGLDVGLNVKLTELKARQIKPADGALTDGTVTGLQLLPSAIAGRGKWRLRFVSPETAKRRDMGLGAYPEVSIGQARELATAARKLLANGVDPLEESERKRLLAEQIIRPPTFKEAAVKVHEEHKASWSNGKHVDQWINTLTTYAMSVIGERTVDTLKPADFADVLRPIWITKPETARRVKQRCHAVMKWCWGKEYVQGNVVDMVDTLLPKQSVTAKQKEHHPAMPWRMLPEFVNDVVHAGEDVTRHLLEFTILTAARSGESRGMTWAEVDLAAGIWTVPARRMKAKVMHRVPLSRRAVEILEQRRAISPNSAVVFPSLRGKVLTDMALTKFLRHHKAASDTPGRVATAHGFRSSFRDWASETGVPRDLAERALAHTIQNAVEAAYHRTDLLEQRRSVMEAWAAQVCGAELAGNVALAGQELSS
jgi:integrase